MCQNLYDAADVRGKEEVTKDATALKEKEKSKTGNKKRRIQQSEKRRKEISSGHALVDNAERELRRDVDIV